MSFVFDYMKAIQAVSVLLRCAGRTATDNYLRVLKLLYIAEREALKETGFFITGDRISAMKNGPVLSHVYDLIMNRDPHNETWNRFVERENYNICLIDDPGKGKLSRYEVKKLQEVWERYRLTDEWELVQETHGYLEWQRNNPGESSKRIPLEDILEAVGRSADRELIEQRARNSAAFKASFGTQA